MRKPVLCLLSALLFVVTAYFPSLPSYAESRDIYADIDARAAAIEDRVVSWRRDIHEHPELSNEEVRTAGVVERHLKNLGLDVQTGVAGTGVIGILKGGRPGKVVALRADMDGLPVEERVDIPFASKVRGTYNGKDVGVMHACGHDNHVAILMGAAQVLTEMREDIPGTVMFIFQPAEEGPGGADTMVDEGVFDNPHVDAVMGLHVTQGWAAGELAVRSGGAMAGSDYFSIRVRGRQTHAAMPWAGVDPIVTASQIVLGLQTVISRNTNILTAPAVVTVGTFEGGVRSNIIPDDVTMTGTIRTLDSAMQENIHRRVKEIAERIAESAGATAEVIIRKGTPVTYNDPALLRQMAPTLARVVGEERLHEAPMVTGAEDFAFFLDKAPGLYFFLGVRPSDVPAEQAVPNHSPFFYADESALVPGVRAMATLAIDYLSDAESAMHEPARR